MSHSITAPKCPSCSRSLYFSHNDITLIQCGCGAIVQRVEDGVIARNFELIKQPASIIQPGTEGRWNNLGFKVTGRFRIWMKEAVFSYWTIIFEDGKTGYLGEGYGLYAIYEKMELERHLGSAFLDSLSIGAERELFSADPFLLENEQSIYKWEMEGEVYLPATPSRMRIFEFAAIDGRRVEVMEFAKNQVYPFRVNYTSFTALELTNTRNWQPFHKTVTCVSCSKAYHLKTFPFSQSFACPHCGSKYETDAEGNFVKHRNVSRTDVNGSISLGANAIIKGISYEVVGYAFKEEANIDHAQWKEYALFNPQEGFAFLSEYNGNWIFLREEGQVPVIKRENPTEFWYGKERFDVFNRYKFKTINAAGEFPYNIFNDKDKSVAEFISPPAIWIQERSNSEGIKWFLGEHISGNTLQAAFGESIIMPAKIGVGAVEPKGFVRMEVLTIATIVSLMLIFILHIVTTFGAEKRVLLNKDYGFDSLHTVSFVTAQFELEKWRSNLQFIIEAPVDNSWFEFSGSLVNVKTGTEYSIVKGVEQYHGYTDGESWREGSTKETTSMNEIPAGTYFLQFSGTREERYWEPGGNSIAGFYLKVTYDVPESRNLWVCIIILVIAAFVQYQVVQLFERARWSNSPFSPYNQDTETESLNNESEYF